MRTMLRAAALAALLISGTAFAADDDDEEMASAEETQKVAAAIAKIGCKSETVEKESASLYEVDDAICEIGQYDIKLNGAFKITSITLDE
ncbi:PepSY domain-containing protein [Mangrovicella endophytica]|uniref:PepSY domain-containing protein n=1 Tax=Mangrovicella endophytica TaxID=2066697 RepID=UPI000C9DBE0C|nr:PepSY domain-containing protein [Mangrovicella endophytica]